MRELKILEDRGGVGRTLFIKINFRNKHIKQLQTYNHLVDLNLVSQLHFGTVKDMKANVHSKVYIHNNWT